MQILQEKVSFELKQVKPRLHFKNYYHGWKSWFFETYNI